MKRAIKNEMKAPCPKNKVEEQRRNHISSIQGTMMNTGFTKDAKPPGLLSCQQSSRSLKGPPSPQVSCIPRSTNWRGQNPVMKNGPSSMEISCLGSPDKGPRDWIGSASKNLQVIPPSMPSKNPTSRHASPTRFPSPIPNHTTPARVNHVVQPQHNLQSPDQHQVQKLSPSNTHDHSFSSGGTKRKAPAVHFPPKKISAPSPSSCSTNKMMGAKNSVDELFCETCKVSCSSILVLNQHLQGRQHKAKWKWMQQSKECKGKPSCDVCQIWCSNTNALEMHLKGQKHKARLLQAQTNGGDTSFKMPIRCELCQVNCMDEDLFKMHLMGKLHAARLRFKERGSFRC